MATEKKSSESSSDRIRNFATVVYEESAPENWLNTLDEMHIAAYVSPLHDKDMKDDGSGFKKSHYHVMVMFEGVKTEKQAREVFEKLGGVGCEPIRSKKAYARYLCHLDSDTKTKYNVNEVKSFGGADYSEDIEMTGDRYAVLADIMDFCDNNNVASYRDLMQYCRRERRDWFKTLCDNSYVIMEYLKSMSWSQKQAERKIIVNLETGEECNM